VRRSRNGGRDGSESYARLSSFSPALISFDGWFLTFDSIPAPEKCLTCLESMSRKWYATPYYFTFRWQTLYTAK